jgi:ABC-type branched-subunit amino acid transport system substrate-binding protein
MTRAVSTAVRSTSSAETTAIAPVEMVRKLVEQDEVLLLFQTLGTPPNTAIQSYLNDNKVPQLFSATGADKWNDPKHYPWTMGWQPSYRVEARIYARYILKNLPGAKIAVSASCVPFGSPISCATLLGSSCRPGLSR